MDPNYKKRGLNSNYNINLEIDRNAPVLTIHAKSPHGESEGGPLALRWSQPLDDSLRIISVPPMMLVPTTTAQMGESTIYPKNRSKIADSDKQTAGLSNPDGAEPKTDLLSLMAPNRMKAPQIEDDRSMIQGLTNPMDETMNDPIILNSQMPRNGKGMGSESDRPLPSTHLGDGVR